MSLAVWGLLGTIWFKVGSFREPLGSQLTCSSLSHSIWEVFIIFKDLIDRHVFFMVRYWFFMDRYRFAWIPMNCYRFVMDRYGFFMDRYGLL